MNTYKEYTNKCGTQLKQLIIMSFLDKGKQDIIIFPLSPSYGDIVLVAIVAAQAS